LTLSNHGEHFLRLLKRASAWSPVDLHGSFPSAGRIPPWQLQVPD
jgi:hypothetical protein